ncbi:hypothetical protein [Paenibacillus sp. BR2-3]|uniref:hypothetical protein n=1 Tax=Paenibacillus sp. BR2-3 TaxID=3048494 RepID=UPI0039773F36
MADASHELKIPLAITNTMRKWLHYIKSETERMTRLTNDLLYLTQMDVIGE